MNYGWLRATRPWRDIPGCPGRAVLRAPDPELDGWVRAHGVRHEAARDPVWVWDLPGGGVLSYEKPDGSFVHTLNTDDGLVRKCAALGIPRAEVHVDGPWAVRVTQLGGDRATALRRLRAMFPDQPLAATMALRLPVVRGDLSRDAALRLVREIAEEGGEASAAPVSPR